MRWTGVIWQGQQEEDVCVKRNMTLSTRPEQYQVETIHQVLNTTLNMIFSVWYTKYERIH